MISCANLDLEKCLKLGMARAIVSKDFLNKEFLEYKNRHTGVYLLYFPEFNKVYIGSASDLYVRRNTHLFHLRNNTHKTKALQEVYNKNVEQVIVFIVYETQTREKAFELEQSMLISAKDNEKLINVSFNVYQTYKGFKHGDETKNKLKVAMALRTTDPKHGENISRHARERFSNTSEKEKQAERTKLAWQNPETREKLLKANQNKKIHTNVVIDGTSYPSTKAAANKLGIPQSRIVWRLKSPTYPEWRSHA